MLPSRVQDQILWAQSLNTVGVPQTIFHHFTKIQGLQGDIYLLESDQRLLEIYLILIYQYQVQDQVPHFL